MFFGCKNKPSVTSNWVLEEVPSMFTCMCGLLIDTGAKKMTKKEAESAGWDVAELKQKVKYKTSLY
jgi:hypothetical protein